MDKRSETQTKQSVLPSIDVNKEELRKVTVKSLFCGSLVTPRDNPGIAHLKYFDF